MRKTLVFDMDGTIADLYGVNGWLENLREENARPYIEAKPLYDMDVLASILGLLRLNGWTIAITSWLSKANCTRKNGGFQILVDDNEEVRKGWHLGDTINANENIIEKLVDLLVAEYE